MKRFSASVVAVLLLFNMLLPYAKCTDTTVERIDYDDGSYAINDYKFRRHTGADCGQ